MLTVKQVALRLGVGPEQVRRLARAGQLPARKIGQALVFDEDAVDSRARLSPRPGRALAPRTAWGAVWMLSGDDADWLATAERSRLRSRLRTWDAGHLLAATRMRADRYDLRVLPAYRDRVLAATGVVASGMSAASLVGADIVADGAADEVYCTAATLALLRRDLGLSERGQTNIVVRVPTYERLPLTGRHHMPRAAVGLDLAESVDVRTRRAGFSLLADALAGLGE